MSYNQFMLTDDGSFVGVPVLDLQSTAESFNLDSGGFTLKCGCASCLKVLKNFDGMGGLNPTSAINPLTVLTGDTVANDTSTTAVVEADGAVITSTIDGVGDKDFYKIELVAGQTYDIAVYLKLGGPSGVPLADAFVELYDADGVLLTSADGGGPNTPQGLDALLTFKAETSGVYYVNARAFDQDGTNGTDGDGLGDYDLFVKTTTEDPFAYKPYYDIDSPLHSLDWGSQLHGTSRNPDGANGPRDNGNVSQGVADNAYGITGKNVVTYYFAKLGDVFVSEDPTTPGVTADIVQLRQITEAEKDAYRLAFEQYENVADVVYVEVQNRHEADFRIITYNGTPGPGASLLGRASPPGEESAGQMEFNAGDERYTEAGLTQGGFFFTTLLHEIGHAHGLAHPHDNGGRSSVMRGAGGGTGGIGGDYGDFGLSQGVFTVMSYNDAFDLRPDGAAPDDAANFGWVGTLSPLDIAVIQDKYGVNEEANTGDDVYVLKDANERGAFYQAIWDAGGKDSVQYVGVKNAVIDLRAATLQYEEGGGGRVSYIESVQGGFTIANGVTVENASSGAGNDVLTGNAANNTLSASYGDDQVFGGAGGDTIRGGEGQDRLFGEDGNDTVSGGEGLDDLFGGAGLDVLNGDQGADRLIGGANADRLAGGSEADVFAFLDKSDSSRTSADTILDFNGRAGDRIDLTAIDANELLAGDQAFRFMGLQKQDGAAGTLQLRALDGGKFALYGFTDDVAGADIVININTSSLSGDHFLL